MKPPPRSERHHARGGCQPPPETNPPSSRPLFVNRRSRYKRNRGRIAAFQGSDESISAARLRFDVPGILGGVSQRPPQLVDCRVQAVLEIDEGSLAPDLLAQLFTGNQFAGMRQQDQQNLEWLACAVRSPRRPLRTVRRRGEQEIEAEQPWRGAYME